MESEVTRRQCMGAIAGAAVVITPPKNLKQQHSARWHVRISKDCQTTTFRFSGPSPSGLTASERQLAIRGARETRDMHRRFGWKAFIRQTKRAIVVVCHCPP